MNLRAAIELACIIEATVPKPGNVSPIHSFADLNYLDFVRCAIAVGPILADGEMIGPTVNAAVAESKRVSPSNVNLGIILLLAPLCVSSLKDESVAKRDLWEWQESVSNTIQNTTHVDAALVYQAIRMAGAGGLGKVEDQDVSRAPSVSLLEAMQLAADRDTIAKLYVSMYKELFLFHAVWFIEDLQRGVGVGDATLLTYLRWMALEADSLIARKRGIQEARESQRLANEAWERWPKDRKLFEEKVSELDAWCREFDNKRNPGTSADLTAATLFVAFASGEVDHLRLKY